nr:hypothetical protein BaRGS_001195 [Batillaria attramentaria]
MSSDSASSLSSDTDADTVRSISSMGHTRHSEHKADGQHTGSISSAKTALEPNIDFELDVKVFIDNGKCILYPKEAKEEEFKRWATTPSTRQKMKRMESAPPALMNKKQSAPQVETTVFFMPSVDVKEMIISPCLLDFLEQALEPLPISPSTQHKKVSAVDMDSVLNLNMDLDASQASLGLPMGPAFFPVDVVVNIKVEPSTIRFNCQPISRVECLLQVPSLELVFSTKKTDVEGLLSDGSILEHGASFMEMVGKDSLSLNVEFIRVNISRTRKVEIQGDNSSSRLDPQQKSTVVRFSVQVTEDPDLGRDPDHRAGLTLYAIEGRVDYMGSSVLMTRLSTLDVSLHDEWHVEKHMEEDTPVATTRSANLFVNGSLTWDQFHLMISRSTTPDLIKLVGKLDEFFSQQLTSSRRAFSAFGSISSGRRVERRPSQDSVLAELRHHRHWQGALEHLTGCHFSMLPHMLPNEGMILGGTITLRGRNLTLASFHGINFRSRYWALFNIQHPYILFSTEAQKMQDEGVHIVQDLQFMVGQEKTPSVAAIPDGQPIATISKVSRGHIAPQQFTSVREWFHYAFSSVEKGESLFSVTLLREETKDIDAFPEIKRDTVDSPVETRKVRKSQTYNHETEIIFALPALYMNLKSTHCQGKHEPQQDDPKPVVECSFMTEFYDHIKVAMDAEVILFLHDLVSSYIKEKDKAGSRASGQGQSRGGEKSPETERRRLTDPTTALKQDWREFHCKTWQMEPTVRLLHWASTQIDPVGADYVLQKLGFSHARVTIPKWMQRGFMDPLDKVLSLLVDRLIITLRDQQKEEECAEKGDV